MVHLMEFLCALAAVLGCVLSSHGHHTGKHDYQHQEAWGGFCALSSSMAQSPIDLIDPDKSEELTESFALPEQAGRAGFAYLGGDNSIVYTIGGGIQYNVPMFGGVTSTLANFHFHWSTNETNGSEHALNGHRYAAETHLVTVYTTSDGDTKYAVLARFYRLGKENAAVSQLLLKQDIASFDLTALYPYTTTTFLTYDGSLTTPNCDEKVHWIVVPEPLEVSAAQIATLRAFTNTDGTPENTNVRDLQALNGRKITKFSVPGSAYSIVLSKLNQAIALLKKMIGGVLKL